MFLIDKYRPTSPDGLLFNREIYAQMAHLASQESMPHIIVTGPPGGGKEILVDLFLKSIYGKSVGNVRRHQYDLGSGAKKKVKVLQSNYHIVIEPTNTNHDKHVIQTIIAKYARYNTTFAFEGTRSFKTIVINNIENLAINSQAALRRTMEIYARQCRFIMICNNLSKIFDPLRSRCRILCVPLPSQLVIDRVIDNIAVQENITIRPETRKIMTTYSGNNLKKAIWFLECRRMGHEETISLDVIFDRIIQTILESAKSKDIVSLFSDRNRANVYSALITTIRGSEIIVILMERLLEVIDDQEIARRIIQFASTAEFNHIQGRREIMHIDYFVAEVMCLLRERNEK